MQAIALTPAQREAAPELAARLLVILVALAATIAHVFLKDPRHVAIILPLCRYLNRTGQRFTRLMARVAAGTAQARPRTGSSRTGTAPVRLPTRKAWLLHVLRLHPQRHDVALRTHLVEQLLSTPDAAAVFAAAPQAARLLRPLCRLLGVTHTLVPTTLPRRRKPNPPATPPEAEATPAFAPRRQPEPCPHHRWPWPLRPAPAPAPRRLLFDPAIIPFFLA